MTPIDADREIHVELHDARVEAVTLHGTGELLVALAHLCVYEPEGSDVWGVWSYEARIVATLCSASMSFPSFLQPELDTLSDGGVRDRTGKELPVEHWRKGVANCSIWLKWAVSGAELAADASVTRLELLRPLQRVETWNGPL